MLTGWRMILQNILSARNAWLLLSGRHIECAMLSRTVDSMAECARGAAHSQHCTIKDGRMLRALLHHPSPSLFVQCYHDATPHCHDLSIIHLVDVL